MKKYSFIFLCLLSFLTKSYSQNFIVTISNDTISFTPPLDVDNNNPARWRKITIKDSIYKVTSIKCILLENSFYYNADGRRLWQRVVHGKINVFALNVKDTIPNTSGLVSKRLLVQKGDENNLIVLTNKTLSRIVEDDSLLSEQLHEQLSLAQNGKALVVSGCITSGVSAGALIVTGFMALFDWRKNYTTQAIVCGSGIVLGALAIPGGIIMSKRAGKVSLHDIYYYNSK